MKPIFFVTAATLLLVACLEPAGTTTYSTPPPPDYKARLLAAAPDSEVLLTMVQLENEIRSPAVSLHPAVEELDPFAGIHLSTRNIRTHVVMASSKPVSGELTYAFAYQDPYNDHAGYITLHYEWWDRWVRTGYSFPEDIAGRLSVTGWVWDSTGKRVVPGATVEIQQPSGDSVQAVTNQEGRFTIAGIVSELSNVNISAAMYEDVNAEIHPEVDEELFLTAQRAATSTLPVLGSLAYRSTCEGQLETELLRAQLVQGRVLGPWLSLEDAHGHVVARTLLDPRGTFQLLDIGEGDFTLRVEAEALEEFWYNGQVTTGVSVTITESMVESGATVELPALCIDNDAPEIEMIQAAWGADYMAVSPADASHSEILHLEAASGIATLSVAGGPEVDLRTSWGSTAGAFGPVQDDGTSDWLWTDIALEQNLVLHTTDGRGGHRVLTIPTRLHQQRIEAQPYGGWQDFTDHDAFFVYEEVGYGTHPDDGWHADVNGMALRLVEDTLHRLQGIINAVTFGLDEPLTVSPVYHIHDIEGPVTLKAGFMDMRNPNNWVFGIRTTEEEAEWQFKVHDQSVAFGNLPFTLQAGDTVELSVTLDPVRGRVIAHIAVNEHDLSVSIDASFPADLRVSHAIAIGTNLQSERLLSRADIVVEGIDISRDETVFVFPSIPGELDGVVYDQDPFRVGRTGTAITHDGLWISSANPLYIALPDLPMFSRVLLEGEGTILTSASFEEALDMWGAYMHDYEEEVAVPLLSNDYTYLY